jgi:class 3 adenylate cyclase
MCGEVPTGRGRRVSGEPATPSCPRCGQAIGYWARFCERCGLLVKGAVAAIERRVVTAVFVDLVGSTQLSTRLDPEDFWAIVEAYQAHSGQVFHRYGGYVAQFQGDGIVVYFGYPEVREDDAERAAASSLELIRTLPDLNRGLSATHGIRVAIRAGIHTGPAIVGPIAGGGHREITAIGEAINLAARLQGFAEPDTAVVSETTLALLRGSYIAQDLGRREVRGIDRLVGVHRLLRPTRLRSRAERRGFGLTELVGRDVALAELRLAWSDVGEGGAVAVSIVGEPGVGKSRLVRALRDELIAEPHVWLEAACSSFRTGTALWPVQTLVQQLAGRGDDATEELDARRIAGALTAAGLGGPEEVALVADLLGVEHPAGERVPDESAGMGGGDVVEAYSPARRRRAQRELIGAWLVRLSERRRVVLVVEDEHWADPSTVEWLQHVAELPARLLLVVTSRMARDHWAMSERPWRDIVLERLDSGRTREMIRRVSGARELPFEIVEQLAVRSEGYPLFVEELTYLALTGDGDGPLPATLDGVLGARLDRMGAAKQAAQLASIWGRESTVERVAALAEVDLAAVETQVLRLLDGEILEATATGLRFRHALVEEAAYRSILGEERKALHRAAATVLGERFLDESARHPDVLAHHQARGGLHEAAIANWRAAAGLALIRSAGAEAAQHNRRALESCSHLSPPARRRATEGWLHIGTAAAHMVATGYASKAVGDALDNAADIARELGDVGLRRFAVHGLSAFHHVRGDNAGARSVSDEFLRLAEESASDEELAAAAVAAAGPQLYGGYTAEAAAIIERGMAALERLSHDGRSPRLVVQDPHVALLCYRNRLNWHTGDPAGAVADVDAALVRAEGLGHPFSLSWALNYAIEMHLDLGAYEAARTAAERAVELAEREALALFGDIAGVYRAWACLHVEGEHHDPAGLVREMTAGRARYERSGARLGITSLLVLEAKGLALVGRHGDALALLADALSAAQGSGERGGEPEILRCRAGILLAWTGNLRGTVEGGGDTDPRTLLARAATAARAIGYATDELMALTDLVAAGADYDERGVDHDHATRRLRVLVERVPSAPGFPHRRRAAVLVAEATAPLGPPTA